MGDTASKTKLDIESYPVAKIMHVKYGPKSVEFLPIWSHAYGFPEGGSFSLNQIKILRKKFIADREKRFNSCYQFNDKVRVLSKYLDILRDWEDEASARERKRVLKNLPFPVKNTSSPVEPNPEKNTPDNLPPPYTTTTIEPCTWPSAGDLCVSACSPQVCAPPLTAASLDFDMDVAPLRPAAARGPAAACVVSYPTAESAPAKAHLHGEENYKQTQPANGQSIPIPSCAENADGRQLRPRQATAQAQMPMLEVAGVDGPVLVFRPWTATEIDEFAKNMPDPTVDGVRFADELIAFCKEFRPCGHEIKRLLARRMTPCDLSKFVNVMPSPDLRPVLQQTNEDEYSVTVKRLAETIAEAFPRKIDMTLIEACKQRVDEGSDEFIHRITEVFDIHSGLKDRRNGVKPEHYEKHLCHAILRGLLPEVLDILDCTYIGCFDNPKLEDLRVHARHAYRIVSKQPIRRRASPQQHKASLTMLSYARPQRTSPPGRYSRGNRGGPTCSNCNAPGHFAEACPSIECYHCHKMGHVQKNCYHYRRHRRDRRSSSEPCEADHGRMAASSD